ncbi:presequence protease, mitochondrial isoform X1 [Coccinella septempunctata]|uniref:presequence protease, mitochondrial isoform X1 n=1 Tax=Coccinella septempunctata TaxID=41139 RepID=UPI001D08979F|nr:presequence protease, mitochondrial isoform X1 [Coccinella septempunctata]
MWSRKLKHLWKPSKSLVRSSSQTAPVRKVNNDTLSDINKFVLGETVHGFQVKEVREIKEFKVVALLLVHEKTKSEYLHLFRNDSNNVFSVNFRTTPRNSTGLPHILEHIVLCGSEMYPVRDPFFKMLNRSLATFMNAMTGSDFTMYPFSSQNLTDFRNLQRIYLDAVFRPELKELDFMEEGWRLENTDLNDVKSPLFLTGVVYNEMKGAFSENERILGQKLQNLILPDHTYSVISGGDPMKIPDLTWEDLKNFHKNHYHPSNARFYSYGNFPLLPSLEYINNEYLSKYTYLSPENTKVPPQKRWMDSKEEHIYGRFENMGDVIEKQNSVVISLLMSDITDIYETFVLNFITELLIRGSNAPFYRTMIEPNFSGGFTQTTGFDNQTRDSIFTVGLQGLKQGDMHRVAKIFDYTIDKVIKVGFDEKHIESVLHRYELSLKHETSNFGLHLLFGLVPIWNHDGHILNIMEVNKLLGKLQENMQNNPKYLQEMVKKHFKDNKHRLTITMTPDVEYEEKLSSEEKRLTEKKSAELTLEEKEDLFKKNLELKERQSKPQNTEILPTLSIDDVSTDVERIPVEHTTIGHIPVQINRVNTNGIVYFKGILSTMHLSPEQQMLLPLFCYVINKLGTSKFNYKEFDSLAQRKTSGLDLNVHVGESLYTLHTYEPGVAISSYCLEKNLDDMWELWSQIFNINQLEDVARFKMLVQLYMANLTQGLADSGHIYAMQAAAALVSGSSSQKEYLTGLQHIAYMKKLMNVSNYPAMLRAMLGIAKAIFNEKNLRCCFNVSDDQAPSVLASFRRFISEIPEDSSIPLCDKTYVTGKIVAPKSGSICQHQVLNVPVNYCSKSILTAPYSKREYAQLRVLARLLTSKYLHPTLRERYGAYGAGARMTTDGVFTYYSYRDPRNLQTLDIFDQTRDWLKYEIEKVTPQEIVEAKLGVFQGIDQPVSPSNKGCNEFYLRLTPEELQRHRAEVMAVNKKNLHDVGYKYLSGGAQLLVGKVILGPKTDCDTSKRKNEMWTVVDNSKTITL